VIGSIRSGEGRIGFGVRVIVGNGALVGQLEPASTDESAVSTRL
jgi:hypothetical protein